MAIIKPKEIASRLSLLAAVIGLLIGLVTFCLESLRVEPTFGLSIPIWSVGPLFALLRFGLLACLVSSLTAAGLIVSFTATYFGVDDAAVTLISIGCAALLLWRTGANRFVDGVLISFVLVVPLVVWRHQTLFTLDFNAGFLVLSTTLLSLLGPALLVQWLALRPSLLVKIAPKNFPMPQRRPLQMAALVRLLLVPLMLLSVLVTTHFFTTEWVYSRSAQLERGSKILAEVLVDLARVEFAQRGFETDDFVASDAGKHPLQIASPSPNPLPDGSFTGPDYETLGRQAKLNNVLAYLNDRVLTDFRRRHADIHFDMSYGLLPQDGGEFATGLVLPADAELQTNIDFVYKRVYQSVTPIKGQGMLLQTVVTPAPSVDSGLRYSVWGLLASVLLLLGAEWLYRRWLVRIGRQAGHTFQALRSWAPGQRPQPTLPKATNVLSEFDLASEALDGLVAEVESQYNALTSLSDERQRLLNQQLATLSALQEPVVVLTCDLHVDERRSFQLTPTLLVALEPILADARSAVGIQSGLTSVTPNAQNDEYDSTKAAALTQALIRARSVKQPQFDVEFHFDGAEGRFDFWVSVGVIESKADPTGDDELVLLFTDVSLLLEAQQTAAKSAHMASLGEVATGAAHQLNQPLNIIRMSALNLARYLAPGGHDGPKAQEKLERIHAQIDRAAEIIDGMKAFARQADAHKTPLAVSNEVASALEQMARQFAAAKVNLERTGQAENAVVSANAASIKAIVHSLIGNALDAFIEFDVTNPCVMVHESVTEDHYVLSIADNGGGIDEAHLEHIFDPFFTTKHSLQRTGLGLALVWRLVDELGGRIECENASGGALFQISLPLKKIA